MRHYNRNINIAATLVFFVVFYACKKDSNISTGKLTCLTVQKKEQYRNKTFVTTNTFNTNNQLIQKVTPGSNGNVSERFVYYYNPDGTLNKYSYIPFFPTEVDTILNYTITFHYYPDGNLSCMYELQEEKAYIDSFSYDPNLNWCKLTRYIFYLTNKDLQINSIDSIILDVDGNPINIYKFLELSNTYYLSNSFTYLSNYKQHTGLPTLPIPYWPTQKLIEETNRYDLNSIIYSQKYKYIFNPQGYPYSLKIYNTTNPSDSFAYQFNYKCN